MPTISRVVIGIDLNDPALNAERWVASYVSPDAELVLVHVVEVPPTPAFLRRLYAPAPALLDAARLGGETRLRAMSLAFGQRRIWLETRIGDPATEIAEVAREYGADLIVVGRHGLGVGSWGRIGRNSDRLLRQAPVPVLLAFGAPVGAPRRVLVALDDGPDAGRIAEWAGAVLPADAERLTAIHVLSNAVLSHMLSMAATRAPGDVFDDARVREELRGEALKWLDRLIDGSASPEVRASLVVFGDPATEILSAAEQGGADLIVVGTRGAGRVRQAIMGSVARDVLRGATRPVLVVGGSEDTIVESGAGAVGAALSSRRAAAVTER
ncbi:MAG TPA: universal stress protein [Gemmatimonadaceae bacterium]|nr:universal stress protein [Gemmatimonadaceae bacterium]